LIDWRRKTRAEERQQLLVPFRGLHCRLD
jgi:hypothetical protein